MRTLILTAPMPVPIVALTWATALVLTGCDRYFDVLLRLVWEAVRP